MLGPRKTIARQTRAQRVSEVAKACQDIDESRYDFLSVEDQFDQILRSPLDDDSKRVIEESFEKVKDCLEKIKTDGSEDFETEDLEEDSDYEDFFKRAATYGQFVKKQEETMDKFQGILKDTLEQLEGNEDDYESFQDIVEESKESINDFNRCVEENFEKTQ